VTVFSDTVKPQVGEIWKVREDYILILERNNNRIKYMQLTGYSFGKTRVEYVKNFIECERLD
jgi:hypothetical protein